MNIMEMALDKYCRNDGKKWLKANKAQKRKESIAFYAEICLNSVSIAIVVA